MVIRTRLMLFMGILSIIVTLVVGFASYKFSEQNAIREAKSKGQIIFNFIYSYREYFKDTQKALILELVEDDRFYPELMSGFVVTRGIWDVFKGHLTGYRFKQATLDPLYPPNKADKEELAMIGRFRSDPSLKQLEGIVKAQGEKFFYMAKPIKIEKKGCLRCHGDPMNAPKDQIEIYGTSNGYNWTHGETVAAFVVTAVVLL